MSPPRTHAAGPAAGPDLVFYDGHCGLCHRSVRFLVTRDTDGSRFRFAPLEGEEIRRHLNETERAALPSSVVVRTDDGRLLTRSDAAGHLLVRLGGGWKTVGTLIRVIPRPLRDFGYDLVARWRARLFARPTTACPVVPPELQDRFLA